MSPVQWLKGYLTRPPDDSCTVQHSTDKEEPPPTFQTLKAAFLEEYGSSYNANVEQLRDAEYPQLRSQVYLDHAGATPYPASIVQKHTANLLSGTLFGNPHSSGSPSSTATSERISAVRGKVLRYFNADPEQYAVVFTSGATAAARIVGDGIDWGTENRKDEFWYLRESHTSVVGIRGIVEERGGRSKAVTAEGIETYLTLNTALSDIDHPGTFVGDAITLFAFPAQCNATGVRYPLNWINKFRQLHQRTATTHDSKCMPSGRRTFLTLLDAASYLSTSSLDLSEHPADFTILSFYKVFGFPTGVGALIVRRDIAHLLKKKYFGGGTVAALTVAEKEPAWVIPREDISSRLEDGTLPFLEILALEHGFEFIEGMGGIATIGRHVLGLRDYVFGMMRKLKHVTGHSLCTVYTTSCTSRDIQQGPIINFNLQAADGCPISTTSVLRLASIHNIHLRAGCFCNPGACQANLSLSSEDVQRNYASHGVVCGGEHDVVEGKATGSLRISFGACSTFEDCHKWLTFLTNYYLGPLTVSDTGLGQQGVGDVTCKKDLQIAKIMLYPIKGCAGYAVNWWPLSGSGLFLDREWMLVDSTGKALTLKRCPKLALISILEVDLAHGYVTVRAGKEQPLKIGFTLSSPSMPHGETTVCSTRKESVAYSNTLPNETHAYFSAFLDTDCRLVRRLETDSPSKSFANNSHFLITSTSSFGDLLSRMTPADASDVSHERLRANIIIATQIPYVEDTFVSKSVLVNEDIELRGSELCTRCQVINVHPENAKVSREPYSTMAKYRNIKGRGVCFGVLATLVRGKGRILTVGDRIRVV
ncbi:hypothetical protein HDU85_003532 [Gaertneriomyces sp. JEL0708]|nr:hypothetical protein HDU85_003532 [Gaertneriomyces sp. JEL0708]